MQKERVIWIDTAKIIGIYLVILGHIVNDAKPIESDIFTLIYSFHMPFFFFMSGYLFRVKESQFDQFVWNKTKSIIVPYFLLNIAAAVLHIPMYIQQHHVPVQELLSCVDGRMGTAFSGATWFLICLFIIMVLAYWVEQVPRLYQILITIISAILAYCVSNHQLPFDLHLIPCSFAFFYVGRLVSGKIPNLKQYRFSLVLLPISTIVVAVLFVLLALYNGSVSIDGMYGKTGYLYFPVAFLGITMVVLLSQWLSIYLSIYTIYHAHIISRYNYHSCVASYFIRLYNGLFFSPAFVSYPFSGERSNLVSISANLLRPNQLVDRAICPDIKWK